LAAARGASVEHRLAPVHELPRPEELPVEEALSAVLQCPLLVVHAILLSHLRKSALRISSMRWRQLIEKQERTEKQAMPCS